MLRFSARLKRKREEASGTKELLLPHAKRIEGEFTVNVWCFVGHCSSTDVFQARKHAGKISICSDDSILLLKIRILDWQELSHESSSLVDVFFWKDELHPLALIGNCKIRVGSHLRAFIRPSAEVGRNLYFKKNYHDAVLHLRYALENGECHTSDYARYYAEICLLSLDGAGRKPQEAARWYLVASLSCNDSVRAHLASLSPDFEKNLNRAVAKHRPRCGVAENGDYFGSLIEDLIVLWNGIDTAVWVEELNATLRRQDDE